MGGWSWLAWWALPLALWWISCPTPPTALSRGEVNCSSIGRLTHLEFIAAGWTKSVYKARFGGRVVALKTINLNGRDMDVCLRRQDRPTLASCYRRSSAKLLREMIILNELKHQHVIKVLGSCVPDNSGPVILATELGQPLDTIQILQMSWQQRLTLALSVASLLHHLAHSPLGSLRVTDLRIQQFVMVGGRLKLSDVDDIQLTEPACQIDQDCYPAPHINSSLVKCVGGMCEGSNERVNIMVAGRDLVRQILPGGLLEPQAAPIWQAYQGLKDWDSTRLLAATTSLIK